MFSCHSSAMFLPGVAVLVAFANIVDATVINRHHDATVINRHQVEKRQALDPAKPGFEGNTQAHRFDATDAPQVAVTHTNAAHPFVVFAGVAMIGLFDHVAFSMRGGFDQPGSEAPPTKDFSERRNGENLNTTLKALGRYRLHPDAGHFYKLYTLAVTWTEARKLCSSDGRTNQLAVPTTEEQYKALGQIVRQENDHRPIWVGIGDIDTEGAFTTISGLSVTSLSYSKWGEGEPNNSGYLGEDCVEFGAHGREVLNDARCSSRFTFVCEYASSDEMSVDLSEAEP